MADISAAAVASLRARTGVSIMACKEALIEANGDEEKAIEILRKRGMAQAAKKAAREQSEGLVFLEESGNKVAVVLLRCETDFVARDDNFQAVGKALVSELLHKGEAAAKALADKEIPALVQKLGENITLGETHLLEAPVIGSYLHSNSKVAVVIGLEGGTKEQTRDLAMHATAMNPLYVSPEEAPTAMLEKEREIWKAQLAKEGKPEAIQEKIMLGKEKKFREENALLTQNFVKDPSKTIQQYLGAAKVTHYMRLAVG